KAQDYQDKYMVQEQYHASFDLFCKRVEKPGAEILELACGPGNITRYLLQQRPDFKILCTDLAPNMLDLARINNPAADFLLLDCRDFLQLNQTWDAIIMGFCLPYLDKEQAIKLIRDSAQALVQGGVIYISTMEDDYGKSGLVYTSDGSSQCFIHYHEGAYLEQALNDSGFDVLHLIRQDFPGQSGTTDLILLARKR
ncbi:MAG TPA: class I SAM-dependent methyltransferase, partial [Bacteroidia bacterium]|nr:class I SAM-dependent methyltransferase [Bacteroidia bacterium]